MSSLSLSYFFDATEETRFSIGNRFSIPSFFVSNDLFLFVQRQEDQRANDCFLLDAFPFVTCLEHQLHRIGVDLGVAFRHFGILEDHRQRFECGFHRRKIPGELKRIFELSTRRIVSKRFFRRIRVVKIQDISDDLFANLSIGIG